MLVSGCLAAHSALALWRVPSHSVLLFQAMRCLSTATCMHPPSSASSRLQQDYSSLAPCPQLSQLQVCCCLPYAAASAVLPSKRLFFGFSNVDSKVYKERRLIGYSPEQLYEVVSSVQYYNQFVPWCVGSHVLRKDADGKYLEAELQIGFQMISERYTSKVKLQPPHLVSSTVADSALFHHLESIWQMAPGPSPNTTWLSFSVDFAFLNPLYANVAHLFFSEVVTRMMGAFEGRCKHLYGPPSFAAAKQARQQLPYGQRQQHRQQHITHHQALQQQQQQHLHHHWRQGKHVVSADEQQRQQQEEEQQQQQQQQQHEALEAIAAAAGKNGVVASHLPPQVDSAK